MLPNIQGLWIGQSLSLTEQLCINSFIKNGHEFHLYTYGGVENIPQGTVVLDANEILPESEIFKSTSGSFALFADWFRWKLLYEKGGYWVDMDVICLKPFDLSLDTPIFGLQSANFVCNAVLGFKKGDELCLHMQNICDKPNTLLPYDGKGTKLKKIAKRIKRKDRSHVGWGEAGGPTGFTRALKHFGLIESSKPFMYFYPVSYECWNSIFDSSFEGESQFFKNTFAIHLWNEMQRNSPELSKPESWKPNSLINQLIDRYMG